MPTLLAIVLFVICTSFSSNSAGLPYFPPSTDDTTRTRHVDEVRFSSKHFSIVGNLYLPGDGSSRYPAVIWVSGSGPGYRTVKQKETLKLLHCFLDRGFACFLIDKPGSGDSKGAFNDDSLFSEMAGIVVEAANTLRTHPRVNMNRIGLFGSSQAGYIMPMAIARSGTFAFMIGLSCPGENSIEQWNYLLEKQMLCEGYSPDRAQISVRMFNVLRESSVKDEFDAACQYFDRNPMIVRSIGYDSSLSETARGWWPRIIDEDDESHFDPVSLVPQIRIPVFLAYGARDTQIDPNQAISAFGMPFYEPVMSSQRSSCCGTATTT